MARRSTMNVVADAADACLLCFSSQNIVPLVTREDVIILWNFVLELPSEGDFGTGKETEKLQLCEACGKEVEKAKDIYEQLVEAVKQFRNIQRKITAVIKDDNGSVRASSLVERCRKFVKEHPYKDFPLLIEDFKAKADKLDSKTEELIVPELTSKSEAANSGDEDNEEIEGGQEIKEEVDSDPDSNQGDEFLMPENDPENEDSEDQSEESERESNQKTKRKGEFQCDKCEFSCQTRRGLRIHLTKTHKTGQSSVKPVKLKPPPSTQVKRFKCGEAGCGKTFFDTWRLKIHTSRHTQQPLFKCQICEEKFYVTSTLRKHEQQRHPELGVKHTKHWSEGSHPCDLCPSVLNTSSGLINHKRLKHLVQPPKGRPCSEEGCEKVFPNLRRLLAHQSKAHGREPAHKCHQCDATFPTWKQKWRHQQMIHEGGLANKPFICEVCGKGFACVDYLHTHKFVAHQRSPAVQVPETGPRVICEVCGKDFKNASCLKSHHDNIHLKLETFLKVPCHLCDKRFLGPRQLQIHLYHHHHVGPKEYALQRPKGEIFKCPVTGCPYQSRGDKSRLDKHSQEVHGERGEKPAKYTCRFCEKGFYDRTKYTNHVQIHENKEAKISLPCDICGKGFVTPRYLRYHKKYTHKVEVEDKRPWKKPRQEEGTGEPPQIR